GYRFIATVTPVAEPSHLVTPQPFLGPETHEEERRSPLSRRLIWAGASVVLLVSALASWYFLRPHPVRSVAVLPLVNLSADPNHQFFAYGVSDELITNLAQISSLHVISHTSTTVAAGRHKTAPEMAHELGVDALVEGSVVQSADRVRLTVQLIDAASDQHL